MNFTSASFAVFFLVVFAVYWRLSHRAQNHFLVLASLAFYASWDWRFVSLILLCTGVNYGCALRIPDAARPRRWVALAAGTSLGTLAAFKYFNFFLDNANTLFSLAGSGQRFDAWNIVLPVGISFYTFQALSYVIDVHRGRIEVRRSFGTFLLYVAFFPQLVAGPIERARRLLPQIESPRRWDPMALREGLLLCLVGAWQKKVIADPLAALADPIFDDPGNASSLALWMALYAFALQIYCDFSGYSKIARGCARMLGFELMQNFRQPYLSQSPRELWQRWHISLSTWLRDYVYIPLGGSRSGPRRTTINLFLTMLLGGLWHGASWNFVVWGGLHGTYLSLQRVFPSGGEVRPGAGPALLRTVATFHLVAFTWIFFRAPTFEASGLFFEGLFALGSASSLANVWDPGFLTLILAAPALLAVDLLLESIDGGRVPDWIAARRPSAEGLVAAALVVMVLLIGIPNAKPFIYFQF